MSLCDWYSQRAQAASQNKEQIIQEIAIDGTVAQVGSEVIGRVCLQSNATGFHFMHASILTGKFGRSFFYT